LNFKPTPYVTLKAEINRLSFPKAQLAKGEIWLYAAQVAVSF
jgi:hypothetical protein